MAWYWWLIIVIVVVGSIAAIMYNMKKKNKSVADKSQTNEEQNKDIDEDRLKGLARTELELSG